MNSAVVRSFVNKSVGNIEEVKRESNDLRNGTMSRIDKRYCFDYFRIRL